MEKFDILEMINYIRIFKCCSVLPTFFYFPHFYFNNFDQKKYQNPLLTRNINYRLTLIYFITYYLLIT